MKIVQPALRLNELLGGFSIGLKVNFYYTEHGRMLVSREAIMSTEDRVLRLENAFTTLAELASNQQVRVSNLEQSFQTLVDLARSVEERMNQHLAWVNQLGGAQANSEAKIAALADAQINTEERIAGLVEAQQRTEQALANLAEAQKHTDQRLDALIDIVREGRNGKS